ncbi:MAG: hypothetical protein V4819_04225 [Verrucomicrobiota bacterium]
MNAHFPSRIFPAVLATGMALTTPVLAKPGDLDPAFGTAGKVATDFGGVEIAADVSPVILNGKMIVAGRAGNDFGVMRYNADGSPDSSFGAGGKVTTDFSGKSDEAFCVGVGSAGVSLFNIVVVVAGGQAFNGSNYDFAIARYDSTNGSPVTGFDGDGEVTTNFGGYEAVKRIVLQVTQGTGPVMLPTIKIVAGGITDHNNDFDNFDFALARYNAAGVLDGTFGVGGKVTTDIGGEDEFLFAMLPQPDLGILAGGTTTSGGKRFFLLVRYDKFGNLDNSFGTLGKAVVNFPGTDGADCLALAAQADGKIIAAGETSPGSLLVVTRLNTDGTVDETFGTAGKVVIPAAIAASLTSLTDIALQADGKILLAGQAAGAGGVGSDLGLVRLNNDGSPDLSFGKGGRVATDFGGINESAARPVVRSDGTIVVAGRTDHGGNHDFVLACYQTAQADARLGFDSRVKLGDNRYNLTGSGQTQKTGIPRDGGRKTVLIGIQNERPLTDSFTVRGTPGNDLFKVKYLHNGANVTNAMVNGTLNTGTLNPGAIYLLKAQITAETSKKGKSRTFSVRGDSAFSPNGSDRVLIKAESK